ncbi:MAG TPA: hypothetical protein ENN56_03145, partial [Firmicutes bacterium]|nr:hypothetical protein [Bacillota bacterium]
MPEPTSDLVWLTCLLRELRTDFADRAVRLRRHTERPWVWIDGGVDRSWIADMTPGASRVRRIRPDDDDAPTEWRLWGGRRTDGAQITDGTALGGDRVLSLRLDWMTRLGESAASDLVIEFGGRHTNALVVTVPDGVIVDVLRPVSGKVNRYRELLPNRIYAPPPRLNRASLLDPWPWDA